LRTIFRHDERQEELSRRGFIGTNTEELSLPSIPNLKTGFEVRRPRSDGAGVERQLQARLGERVLTQHSGKSPTDP
jgi:hypothetical protein